jgi:hypothetical protein
MWGYVASIDNLFWGPLVWNSRATAKRLITEGRLPVPADHKLGAIQKLGAGQESPCKVGTIEYRFEEVRALEVGPGQIRVGELCSPEISIAKIGPRKVEPTQIKSAQTGPRQVWRLVEFRPPLLPHRGATAEHRDMFII